MKKSRNYREYINAHLALDLIWLSLTILLLVVTLHYQWQLYHQQKKKLMQLSANQIELRFAAVIDSFLHEVYSLPLYGRELKTCEGDLLPILQSVSKKNPAILGAVLSDNSNKIICSTIQTGYPLPPPSEQNPTLYGPMAIGSKDKSVFLLEQQLGQYYLGVYILENVFLDILKSSLTQDQLIALYKIKQHENALIVGDSNLVVSLGNIYSTESVNSPIKNLNNYGISIKTLPLRPNASFFYHELPFILGISLLSCILYLKFRSILNNRFSLHYALVNALKRNHFQPVYQPVKDQAGNRYCGAEVLLRWQTDANEIIMPDVFVADAEESGLIVPITLQLIEKSFVECSDLLKKYPNFHLAFNLSAGHFVDRDFFNQFYELCAAYKIPARQLMLELTERQLLDQDDPKLVQKMNDLRLRGYSLAIDDFGTGHASIKYLQHFPFNYLKIDKIFVQAIGTGAITETLNHAIIHMARCLELNIIAEGVETAEQLHFLTTRNVNFVQGWFFAKAMGYEQLTRIVEEDLG
ncbi:putative membrane protein YjcC [Legionella massiliensis]|uniref:Putative membrane protein YjcC n=1 Tax=Legionella massiliensis TaxID=1034943 RepID=A0A078KVG6_9GAMM|nr:EAL domain-containing protein [Legionella massiliensis]CDZ78410.1 putative membrane protein YjcC [Legionella massiliensis]CEE14148.1 putative membrane protein YjcC [Legionella massiliensis]